MVYVYASEVTNLPDPRDFPEVMEGLTENRKEKTLRYLQAKDRKQSLGAGLLLKKVLQMHGADVDNIRLGANGKPELDDICFNLSHSHEMVVCAVSEKAVGCDIEKIKKAPEKLAERYFCENEIIHLNKFQNEEKEREFFRLWTMKESYMKMTGEGMKLALNRFEFVFENPVKVYRDGELCSCFVKEYEIPGYKLTVCAEEAEFADEVKKKLEIVPVEDVLKEVECTEEID